MEETKENIKHYIHDHHLSYALLVLGCTFSFLAFLYIADIIFSIRHPDEVISQGISTSLAALLSLIFTYGYPVLVLILFAGYLGIPIPATSILLALGAFAATGNSSLPFLISIISITNIFGNLAGYTIGRKSTMLLSGKKFHKLGATPERIKAVDTFLKDWGRWCLFITHCVLTPIEVPVNIVAGMSNYPLKRFLLVVIPAEILWTSFYLSLGFLLGTNWLLVVTFVTDIPKMLTTASLGIFAFWIAQAIRKKMKHTSP